MEPFGRILLLDVDGVLVTPPDWYGLKLRREAPDAMEVFYSGPFLAATRGEVDLTDHLPPFLHQIGRSCTPEEFLVEWHEYEDRPNLALWDAVRKLKSHGWPVYLATNQERHRMRHLMDESRLGSFIDGEFASCNVGHRKPSNEYFAEVARRLDVLPERIVFFDDMEENVSAARAAGWTAHLFEDLEGFLRILKGDQASTVLTA